MTNHPTIASLAFTRIALAVRDWLTVAKQMPGVLMTGTMAAAIADEADANLDAVLRCEARVRMDQTIQTIDVTEHGVLVILDDGQELSINATTGHINRC